MPEPEFFILLIVAAVVFGICSALAGGLYLLGRYKKSTVLKSLALIPLIPGLVVFVPMFLLLLGWVCYWIFGEPTTAPTIENLGA